MPAPTDWGWVREEGGGWRWATGRGGPSRPATPPPPPPAHRVAPDPAPRVDIDCVADEPGRGRGPGGEGEGRVAGEARVRFVAGRGRQRAKLERQRARARGARGTGFRWGRARDQVGPGEGEAGRRRKRGREAVRQVDRRGQQPASIPRHDRRVPLQVRVRRHEGAQGADGELESVHARIDGEGQRGRRGASAALFAGPHPFARRPGNRGTQPLDIPKRKVRGERVERGEPDAALRVAPSARQRAQVVPGERVLDVGVVRGLVHAAHGGPGRRQEGCGAPHASRSPLPRLGSPLPAPQLGQLGCVERAQPSGGGRGDGRTPVPGRERGADRERLRKRGAAPVGRSAAAAASRSLPPASPHQQQGARVAPPSAAQSRRRGRRRLGRRR